MDSNFILDGIIGGLAAVACVILLVGLVGCEYATGPSFEAREDGTINYSNYESTTTSGMDALVYNGGCESECSDEGLTECTSIPSGTPVPKETCIQGGGTRECECK